MSGAATIVTPPPTEALSDDLASLEAFAAALASAATAPNTRRTYASAVGTFRAWTDVHGRSSLPATPETVALYVAYLVRKGRKATTIERALVAISQAHLDANQPSPRSAPIVRRVLRGLRRRPGTESQPQRALTEAEVVAMVGGLPNDVGGLRDRALLALGFATGLRRSELVALDIEHVTLGGDFVVVLVVRSKTDPGGRGRRVRAERRTDAACPVRALEDWIRAASVEHGPLFRPVLRGGHTVSRRLNDKVVDRIVKNTADTARIDAARVSAHSLRSGYATTEAARGVPERTLMKRLGHTDPAMTRRYVRLVEED
jgi:site-specific recombinase XerD